jgi:hypothetical protein
MLRRGTKVVSMCIYIHVFLINSHTTATNILWANDNVKLCTCSIMSIKLAAGGFTRRKGSFPVGLVVKKLCPVLGSNKVDMSGAHVYYNY